MTLIRSKFNDDSLPEMYDYLNNIILFDNDIRKIRFALDEFNPSKNDLIVFDKIKTLLKYYNEQKELFLSRIPISNQVNPVNSRLKFPKEIWSIIVSYMPINQRILFRQVDRGLKNITDIIPINETIIFSKKLSQFDGFIQTNINEYGFRTKSNLNLDRLIHFLSSLNKDDQDKLANITKEHYFAKTEVELKAMVNMKYAYMVPEKYSPRLSLKQSVYTLFRTLLIAAMFGFFGLFLSQYNDLRNKQNQFTGEYFLVTAMLIAVMAYITKSIATTKIFSTYKSENASKNMHRLFSAADSKNELALSEIKPIYRRHSTGNISENGHSLFSHRMSSSSNTSATFPEITHIHRQRSYSL